MNAGNYLNPTTRSFTKRIASNTFVDHTGMLAIIAKKINDEDKKYISVSRPRRFGKTVDANMIVAFFEKESDPSQFDNLQISQNLEVCREHQRKYNVIRMDASEGIEEYDSIKPHIQKIAAGIKAELLEFFPNVEDKEGKTLVDVLKDVYKTSKEQIIFVIDEWDAPLKLMKEDQDGQKYYIAWLNSLFKNKDYLALAYMTGILPIKKYGDDSLMNMFDGYSMTEPKEFAPYMGFTEEDVMMLCERHQEEIDIYKSWYDGYLMTVSRMSKNGKLCKDGVKREFSKIHVYNPKSISEAFSSGDIADYWNKTGLFEALKNYIDSDLLGLRTSILEMMRGERKPVNTEVYKNNLASLTSVNQVFTLLIHLGYLTYDAESEEVYIPNKELMEEFSNATEETYAYSMLKEMLKDSMELLQDTWDMKADKVAAAVEKAHMLACSPKDYNRELALSNAVSFAYYAANEYYTIFPEAPAGKGYADLTFIPVDQRNPAMVVELKWNKEVESAIDQIRNKNYTERLRHYAGNILCVGISYKKTDVDDKQYKKHTCIMEKL